MADITYEQLFDALRREKSRDELQQLDPEFYEKVRSFMQDKEALILQTQTRGAHTLAAQRASIEYQNIRKVLKELYERRERKIITLAMHRARAQHTLVDLQVLLKEERVLYDHLVSVLTLSRREILGSVDEVPEIAPPIATHPRAWEEPTDPVSGKFREPDVEESRGDTFSAPPEDHIMVKFLAPVPKFMGKDKQLFGPYGQDDTARLPTEIANVLIKKGRAQAM